MCNLWHLLSCKVWYVLKQTNKQTEDNGKGSHRYLNMQLPLFHIWISSRCLFPVRFQPEVLGSDQDGILCHEWLVCILCSLLHWPCPVSWEPVVLPVLLAFTTTTLLLKWAARFLQHNAKHLMTMSCIFILSRTDDGEEEIKHAYSVTIRLCVWDPSFCSVVLYPLSQSLSLSSKFWESGGLLNALKKDLETFLVHVTIHEYAFVCVYVCSFLIYEVITQKSHSCNYCGD